MIQRGIECLLSYLPNPPLGQDMTQGQFLGGEEFTKVFASMWHKAE